MCHKNYSLLLLLLCNWVADKLNLGTKLAVVPLYRRAHYMTKKTRLPPLFPYDIASRWTCQYMQVLQLERLLLDRTNWLPWQGFLCSARAHSMSLSQCSSTRSFLLPKSICSKQMSKNKDEVLWNCTLLSERQRRILTHTFIYSALHNYWHPWWIWAKQAIKKYVFAVYPLGLLLKIFTKILPFHWSKIIERKKNCWH